MKENPSPAQRKDITNMHRDQSGNTFPDPDLIGNRQKELLTCLHHDGTPVSYPLIRRAMSDRYDPFEPLQALAGRGYVRFVRENERDYVHLTDLGKRLVDNINAQDA